MRAILIIFIISNIMAGPAFSKRGYLYNLKDSEETFEKPEGSEIPADPNEFAMPEDELPEDPFYSGRYFQAGVNAGAGLFTKGLGVNHTAGVHVAARLNYFFEESIAGELNFGYSYHKSSLSESASGKTYNITSRTEMFMLNIAVKYSLTSGEMSRSFGFANPLLYLGASVIYRHQTILEYQEKPDEVGNSTPDTSLALFLGCEVLFPVYKRIVYIGVEPIRYYFTFFNDENDKLGEASFDGDYMLFLTSITFRF